MITSNSQLTPEQKAKFITGNQLESIAKSNGNPKPKINFIPIITGVFAALLIAFVVLKFIGSKSNIAILNPLATKDSTNKPNMGPTVTNPLTGEIVKEADAQAWKDSRPIGVMINNHVDARPQSGLVSADVVYEIVAEGGITRYLAFFLSNLPEKIGPVRSTREYYLVLVKELSDAMIMHIGWSPQALEAIETWPVRSLGRGGAQFWRDQDRLNKGIAIEHTAYVNGPDLRKLGNTLGWDGKRDFDSWKFKDDGPVDTTQQCLVGECDKPITIDFWTKGDYTGAFSYDRATNSYLRYTGYDANDKLIPLVDQESKQRVSVKNLVIQFVTESTIADDEKHRLSYQLVGSGQAIVFLDGKAVKAVWKKESRDGRTKFYDSNGQEILFNRGKIWVSIVPDRNMEQVVY